MCQHKLGSLCCDRTTKHDEDAVGGHTYTASWAPDRRHEDGATQEDS